MRPSWGEEMLDVRVFLNSGFNQQNVPDSPVLLNACAYLDLPSIDVLQDGILSAVSLRVESFSQISAADYCKVGTWYYAITGITMTSMDVCMFSLRPDFILSAGGISAMTFLDGITERTHIAKDDDVFGEYTLDDVLLTPSEPLDLYVGTHVAAPTSVVIVESTIDLKALQEYHKAVTFESATSGDTVEVPQVPPILFATNHKYGGAHGTISYVLGTVDASGEITLNGTVAEGLNIARSLGVESCITSTYCLPTSMFTAVGVDRYEQQNGISQTTSTANGAWEGFSHYEYATVENKRVLSGIYNKYGILTTAGNRTEYAPEAIYHDGDTAPEVLQAVDARAEGSPYYRFRYYYGNDGWDGDLNDVSDSFWQTAVAGSGWQVVPLVYNGRSGSAIQQLSFDGRRTAIDVGYQVSKDLIGINAVSQAMFGSPAMIGDVTDNMYGFVRDIAATNRSLRATGRSGSASLYGQMVTEPGQFGGAGVSAVSTANFVGNAIGAAGNAAVQKATLDAGYSVQKDIDYANFLASQNVVAPEMAVSYNTAIVRDAVGNGYFFYRYRYSDNDLARIDKLLTEYGYRITKPLEKSDFYNRSKFNYIKAHGVTFTGLPAWWANGAALQLAGGVRFWHVLPDPLAYSDGSNE